VVHALLDQAAQALILGSTDLGFVVKEEDVSVPMLDPGKIHAVGVAEWALRE